MHWKTKEPCAELISNYKQNKILLNKENRFTL